MPDGVNQSTFGYALKSLWPNGVKVSAMEKSAFCAMVRRNEKFTGEDKKVAVRHGRGGGRATTMAAARARTTAHKGARFSVERVKDYAVGRIERETMLAANGNEGSIIDAYDEEMDAKIELIDASLCRGIVGDGSGAMGKIATINTGTHLITLESVDDVIHYEIDMRLEANPNRTGNVGSMRAGVGIVTGVDPDAGVITYAVESGGFAPSVADYLYEAGDYDAKISGVQAWIPWATPTAGENFWGVDRSINPSKLAGIRIDASGFGDHREALMAGGSRIGRRGANPDVVVMSFKDFEILQFILESTKSCTYETITTEAGIGVQAISLVIGKRRMKIVPDAYFPEGYAYYLRMDTWELASLTEAPHVIQDDGLELLRDGNDGFEWEIAYYANMICDDPSQNAVVKLPPLA